jgi:hypothetical protein
VVEGAVRYSRQNFMVPVPQVADWAELNAHLLTCCRSDMTRRLHGKTLSKQLLLEEDKVAGLAIPADRFDPRRLVSTTATSQALVRLDTNDYSVPVEYGHRPVVIRASVQTVSIYHAGMETLGAVCRFPSSTRTKHRGVEDSDGAGSAGGRRVSSWPHLIVSRLQGAKLVSSDRRLLR